MISTERDALVIEHVPYVRRVARALAARLPSHVGAEDLEGEGFLALVEMADRFDPDHGVPFAAFAWRRVRGAMLDVVRRATHHTRLVENYERRLHEDIRRRRTGGAGTMSGSSES